MATPPGSNFTKEGSAMTKRRATCDAPGCQEERNRRHLFCRACWDRTPNALRDEIVSSQESGNTRAWTAASIRARQWHRDHPPGLAHQVAHQAYVDRVQQGAWWHD
jgi:hypothetical protein